MVLRSLEQKLESLLEGMFGRAFKTNVQPVELARKLAKEMDEHRTISVSRVYVPNEYVLYLSTADREQFSGYEASLLGELQEYLIEHARREGYALLTQPRVLVETDSDLDVGEFGIATRMAQPKGADIVPDAPEVEAGATMIYKPRTPLEAEAEPAPSPEREVVSLVVNGTSHEVVKRRVTIGRGRDCDIRLNDPNASRQHAELRQDGAAFWLVDLDSTNGLEVNGTRTKRAKLEPGDTITIGATRLEFRRELP
jgi:pSer/pThr/pTyr-binding forkhead associated (FHA) protein